MSDSLWGTLPLASSEIATQWNHLYYFLLIICVVFGALVIGPMIYFAIKYRARPGVQPTPIEENTTLEFLWTAIPTVVVMVIFAWGIILYDRMVIAPSNAMEIRAVGSSWAFTFQYDDGRTLNNELYVPAGRPIKVLVTAKPNDVLHNFYLPDFRIKHDMVPGFYASVWFEAKEPGQHIIFCTQYCGAGHSNMMARLIVLSPEDFELWKWGKKVDLPEFKGVGRMHFDAVNAVAAEAAKATASGDAGAGSLIETGKKLTQLKGCIACHQVEANGIGPKYQGLFGSEVVLQNGDKVIADENYIAESIYKPQAKLHLGYNPVMPSYEGQVTSEELNAIIAYIKSLK